MTTYYVSLLGDDANDGLTAETAWRTLNYAGQQMKTGDALVLCGSVFYDPEFFAGYRFGPLDARELVNPTDKDVR